MVAFVSFVPEVVATLDRDDVAQHRKPGGELSRIQVTPVWELAAFVVAGGLISSLACHLWSVLILLPRVVRALKAQAPVPRSAAAVQSTVETHIIGSSLGLSRAMYAMLVYVAANNPDLGVGILFLPFISVPIGPAVGVLATFDLSALLRGLPVSCVYPLHAEKAARAVLIRKFHLYFICKLRYYSTCRFRCTKHW